MVKNHQPECLDGTVAISDGKTTKPGPEVKTCASETQQGFPSDHQILHLGRQCPVNDGHFPMKKWTMKTVETMVDVVDWDHDLHIF